MVLGPEMSPLLMDKNWVERHLIRVFWSLALMVPICLFITCLVRISFGAFHRGSIVLTLIVGVVAPGMYALRLIDWQTNRISELLRKGHLLRSLNELPILFDLGSTKPIQDKLPEVWKVDLSVQCEMAEKQLSRSLPDSASINQKIGRATLLAQRDRLNEIPNLLLPIENESIEAKLLLAAIYQDMEAWKASSQRYAEARDQELPKIQSFQEPPEMGMALGSSEPILIRSILLQYECAYGNARRAFDGLGFNARKQHRWVEAESIYRRAIDALPLAKPYFGFQLGNLFKEKGDLKNATFYLQEAKRLAPKNLSGPVDQVLKDLRSTVPGMCNSVGVASRAAPELAQGREPKASRRKLPLGIAMSFRRPSRLVRLGSPDLLKSKYNTNSFFYTFPKDLETG
jgi:tetratricopeptide (TPR) repeat protein